MSLVSLGQRWSLLGESGCGVDTAQPLNSALLRFDSPKQKQADLAAATYSSVLLPSYNNKTLVRT
jgi:hypothetical protein